MFFEKLITLALDEDLGMGDITTDTMISAESVGKAEIIAKEDLVICGTAIAQQVFYRLDPTIDVKINQLDGMSVKAKTVVITLHGATQNILKAERTALNFMQRLTGIASKTKEYVDIVTGYPVKICDTRKTTPGFRQLEKYAVRCGGGSNHRMSLADTVLIKDNHISACGGITQAVDLAKKRVGHTVKIEVEVSDFHQLDEVLKAGVDIIMLDNMTPEQVKRAVGMIGTRAISEASGGITAKNLLEFAQTGVNVISLGTLTHSARARDLSLNFCFETR